MNSRIVIHHPNGESTSIEANKFILAFKETGDAPLNFHVNMLTDEILATAARLSHLALKNEESFYNNLQEN
jgi:predicted aconitase with swiveling domain